MYLKATHSMIFNVVILRPNIHGLMILKPPKEVKEKNERSSLSGSDDVKIILSKIIFLRSQEKERKDPKFKKVYSPHSHMS